MRQHLMGLRRAARASRLAAALAAALLGWTLATAYDLDHVQALALQRYGQQAANTVAAWRKMLNDSRGLDDQGKINAVNAFFNRRILYAEDQVVWGVPDYWTTPLEVMGKGAGDCEDYAIAKYVSLLILNVDNSKLHLIYVRAKFGGPNSTDSVAHMVLGYYAQPDSDPLILDNLIDSVRPASMRPDLTPVFSFNSNGLWAVGSTSSAGDPTARLSNWRGVLERMRQDNIYP